jgi:YD repeat-containing protein
LSGFSGTLGDGLSRTYASITQYSAAGLKERESYGTGTNGMTTPLYLKLHYNIRQQLVDLRLGSVNDEWVKDRGALIFYYGTNAISNGNPFHNDTDNNGSVRRQVHHVPKPGGGEVIPQLADYAYDGLNRISSMSESQLNEGDSLVSNVATQSWAYDRFGNRRVTSATGGVSSYNPTYNTVNNRINGLGYDNAGNITADPATGGTMAYDAEKRLLTATNSNSSGTYAYDGEGKRVKRTLAGG